MEAGASSGAQGETKGQGGILGSAQGSDLCERCPNRTELPAVGLLGHLRKERFALLRLVSDALLGLEPLRARAEGLSSDYRRAPRRLGLVVVSAQPCRVSVKAQGCFSKNFANAKATFAKLRSAAAAFPSAGGVWDVPVPSQISSAGFSCLVAFHHNFVPPKSLS